MIALNDDEKYKYVLTRIRPKLHYYLWRHTGMSLLDAFSPEKADVSHGVNFYPLPTNRGKSVITIHDLYFLINPEHIEAITRATLPKEIRFAAHRVDFIIADSESSRNDVINKLDIRPEKVRAVPLAAGPQFYWRNDEYLNNETRKRYTGDSPYILYLGTLEPRKNLVRLIEAFCQLKKRGLPHKLVMAGRKGWLYDDIFQTITKLNLNQEIITPDYVPEEDVPLLYNAAEAFVFPSLYEGFGLPVLEAMACGTPVITTDISSLPEVVGDAGILIHPEDIDGLANSIEKVLNDKELHKSLRKKGLAQSTKFSWEKTARETLDVYNQLLNL